MSILVVCTGCRKRYQVDDKFAGKSGNCPNCKLPIKVPNLSDEVKIHEPEGAKKRKKTTNKLVLKPIAREDTKFNPLVATGIAGIAIVFFVCAYFGGKAGLFNNYLAQAIGLIIVSPVLALAGYSFLRDDELEPYKGKGLLIRSLICGLAYALLWAVFAYISDAASTGEMWNWVFIAPPFFAAGAMIATNTFDLNYENGFFHYAFYLIITILLRWAAGLGWIWDK